MLQSKKIEKNKFRKFYAKKEMDLKTESFKYWKPYNK